MVVVYFAFGCQQCVHYCLCVWGAVCVKLVFVWFVYIDSKCAFISVSIPSLSQLFWIQSTMMCLKARCTWLASWQGQWPRYVGDRLRGFP